MPDRRSNRPLTFVALAAALAMAGCNKPTDTANDTAAANSTAPLPTLPATLPMTTGPATAAAYAPPVAALPAARPIRAVRVANSGDSYAYADDAYAFSHAVGDAPPDYGFDYQGTEPWAWQGYDQSRTFVEPVADGYRYYYYRPGADTPYFVRDPDYGYGYDNGSLAVIYSAAGAILPYATYGPRLGYASRYLQRGEALYEASRGNERRAVNAANWAARQDAIAASRDRWAAAEAQQAGWQAYRARVADQQAQHWAQEAARRDADARRFATWHDDGFRSAPPPRAIPAAWQQAPWAQDQQRYRVAAGPAARPQPAFQRADDSPRAAFQPQGALGQEPVAGRAPPARSFDGRGPGNVGDPRAAGFAAQQAAIAQGEQQRANRIAGQQQARETQQLARQQQAAGAREQQQQARIQQQDVRAQQEQAAHAQQQQVRTEQQQAARQTQKAERQQHAVADRQQQDAARSADRAPQPVHVHRGGDAPNALAGAPHDQQRMDRGQPPRDDQHQAERQQQQMAHQQAAAAHQQQAAMHQQQAAMQHAAQQAQHAAPPPHTAAPHPAPAPHGGGEHGEHHP